MKTSEKSRGQRLREGFEYCLNERDAGVFARARLNYETRYCLWAHQTADGKKWSCDAGKEIFPWAGASDARVPMVDTYILEDVAFLMTVWRRMGATVSGVEVNDAEFGARMTAYLRWVMETQMEEASTQHELLCNYGLERGAAVMGVFWARERQMGYEEVDLENIQALAMDPRTVQQMPILAELPGLILNPATELEAAEFFRLKFGEAKESKLVKLVRDLRAHGHGRIAVPEVVKDRPALKALCLNEDVFLPPEATDIEGAGEVYWRELVSEAQLIERKGTLGWDAEWVERMIETQKGVLTAEVGLGAAGTRARVTGNFAGLGPASRLYEVVHAYVRQVDEEDVPEIRYTCFSPGLLRQGYGGRRGKEDLKGLVALDQPLDYAHGKLPFVLWEREKRSQLVDDQRGYGEVAATMQRQVKVELDSRVDRASIATLPPSFHPPGREPERWGPGARISSMRPGDHGFVAPPKYDPGSKEAELTVTGIAQRYFGRATDELNLVEAQMRRQLMGDRWMEVCGKIKRQVLQLCQQYAGEEIYFRVVGSDQGRTIRATKEEIQGQFDLTVGYNVENLDPKLKKEKLDLINLALAQDVNGIVDRNRGMKAVFDLIDPNLGELLLKPAEAAAQAEKDDEDAVMTKMMSGIPVDVRPGQAHGLRRQRLAELVTKSPVIRERMERDERFRELVEWRDQQLGHQLEQRENAMVGRLGGKAGFDQFSK